MFISTYQNATDFLSKTQSILEKNEVINGLMLGICLRLKHFPERIKTAPYLATVEDEHGLVVAACMTPPRNIVLYSNKADDDEALEMVVQNLHNNSWSVPGVGGPAQVAYDFAMTWEKLTGQKYREGMRERVFELSQVIPPRPSPGVLAVATEEHLDLITQWIAAFQKEALHQDDLAEAQQVAESKIHDRDIYVWKLSDGKIVSLAAKTRPVSKVISVGPVYTPPEYRGMGYASNCVAALSQLLLDSDWKFCCLFTDLSNFTSNSIYQKIGYRPVCDFNEYTFKGEQ